MFGFFRLQPLKHVLYETTFKEYLPGFPVGAFCTNDFEVRFRLIKFFFHSGTLGSSAIFSSLGGTLPPEICFCFFFSEFMLMFDRPRDFTLIFMAMIEKKVPGIWKAPAGPFETGSVGAGFGASGVTNGVSS